MDWFGRIDLNEPFQNVWATSSGDVKMGGSSGGAATIGQTSSGHVEMGGSSGGAATIGQTSSGHVEMGGSSGGDATSSGHAGSGPSTSGGANTGPNISGNADAGPPGSAYVASTGATLSTDDNDSVDEVQSTPEGFTPKTPYIGMKFESEESAQMYYNRYSEHIGFLVKILSSRRSAVDGERYKVVLVCNKAGKSAKGEKSLVEERTRTYTKLTECKARIRVKRVGAQWVVTQFIEEHTHELITKFALKKYLRSHKKIPKEERRFIDLLHDVNLSAGRILQIMGELYGSLKNVPYDSKEISNYIARADDEDRFKDVPQLLDYFEELKKEDPNLYYKFKLDALSRVEMIFWVDGSAREVYKLYHDCISFDTTHMTNMYNMPCAPFIGINRYGQSIQLGCGFVRNEKIGNFVWLFQQFLIAMDGVEPLNIITDQDEAMRTAMLIVFMNTIHRNCRWHIMQKVQEKVGPTIAQNEQLRLDFNEILDYSLTREEFEVNWVELVQKHALAGNKVFEDVYDLREVFVPAYFRDRFFPFLQTTARSEGFNAVLKKYVNPFDNLLRFFKQYMKLQEKNDVAEDGHEFVGEDMTIKVWSDYPMEEQILHTYTLPIYHKFQVELRKITSYNIREVNVGVFEVFPIQGSVWLYGRRPYMVAVDYRNDIYDCQCNEISRDGILCCHVMKVMSHLGVVKYIPDHYILPRWCIPPPDIVAPQDEPQQVTKGKKLSRKDMRMLRYINLCMDFAHLAVDAAVSEKAEEVARKHMLNLRNELADLKKATAAAAKRKKDKDAAILNPATNVHGSASVTENAMAQNPPYTSGRGRPSQKREKSGLQLQPPQPTMCSICKQTEHDARSCPVRMANPERFPLLASLFQ